VRIETVEGKREYAEKQAEFAATSALIRERLIEACEPIRRAASAALNA